MFDDEKGRQTEIKYLQSSFEEYKRGEANDLLRVM